MLKTWLATISLVGCLALSSPAARPTNSADFKLTIEFFGNGADPLESGQMVVHDARVYQYSTESKEIVILDTAAQRLELLDIEDRVLARVTYRRLDEALNALHKTISERADALEKKGGKANLVAARMSRELIDPHFSKAFDARQGRLHLSNGSVEVDASGQAESDASRLRLLATAMSTIVKLGSLRNPDNIPPFTRLDAIRDLVETRRLVPSEFRFVYRLAGPPKKYRWTYQLITQLNDRDKEAIARLDQLRTRARLLTFAEYEKRHED